MQAREQLESLLGEVPAGITVKIEVESGRAIDAIVKLTKDRQVDLILLGMPNRNLLEEKLFGITTMGLCQRTMVPLRIMHLAQTDPYHALQRVHLCWVVEGLRRRDLPTNYQVDAAREVLATVRSQLEALNLTVDPVVIAEGDAVAESLETAQVSDVSAIAITAHSPNKLLDWSVPKLTDELLRRSWHPILYFPPQLPA